MMAISIVKKYIMEIVPVVGDINKDHNANAKKITF